MPSDPPRALAAEAAGCQACDLWKRATQTVFGTGPVEARAIAGQALFGPGFRVSAARGADLELDGHRVVATIHPSAVLRARESDERARAYAGLVEDLRRARSLAA